MSPRLQPRLLSTGDRELLEAVYRLRVEVWAGEGASALAFPDGRWTDDHDEHALHWVVLDGHRLVAAARLCVHDRVAEVPSGFLWRGYLEPAGPVASLNRLVVDADLRRAGLARGIDRARIAAAHDAGCATAVVCAPRARAEHLRRAGWTWLGPARNEDDPSPLTALVDWIVLVVPASAFHQVAVGVASTG